MRFVPQPDLKTEIRMDTTAAQQPGVENAERPELDREDGCTLARRSSADGRRNNLSGSTGSLDLRRRCGCHLWLCARASRVRSTTTVHSGPQPLRGGLHCECCRSRRAPGSGAGSWSRYFGLRNPHAGKEFRVFEVDRPETQQWKRECLAKANLQIPNWLSLVTVDFEQQAFLERLKGVEFNDDRRTFFTWLGVVPYLSRDTVFATLSLIARLPDAEVVFDYGEPVDAYPPARRARYEAMIASAAAAGEPWLSFFVPDELESALCAIGFGEIEDLSPRDIAIRYFGEHDPPRNAPGAHIIRAQRVLSS
jgi:hypothetical protein